MSDRPQSLQDAIREIAGGNASLIAELGGQEKFDSIVGKVGTLDTLFEQRGGTFFHAGGSSFETAERFTQIHVEGYRNDGRPSLPALAVHHAEIMGIEKGSPEYKAMIMVATRAEMDLAVSPDYHSKFHYTDVAAMTANFLEKNNAMVKAGDPRGTPLTKEEQAITFIAAIGHDIDHEGKSNPPSDPLFNEKKSFGIMEPLLKEAGLTQAQIADIKTILMTTSPNGPHSILKTIAQGDREGEPITVGEIQARDAAFNATNPLAKGLGLQELKFPELTGLDGNKKLTQMAAMVSDADLYASSGAGMASSAVMSKLLTDEGMKYNNSKLDFTTDKSREFFLDGIVGKMGFASNAGREVANESFEALREETRRRLDKAPIAIDPPKPGEEGGSKFIKPAAGDTPKTPVAKVSATPKPGKPGGMG